MRFGRAEFWSGCRADVRVGVMEDGKQQLDFRFPALHWAGRTAHELGRQPKRLPEAGEEALAHRISSGTVSERILPCIALDGAGASRFAMFSSLGRQPKRLPEVGEKPSTA
jgi:hypothetical protein